MHKVRKGKREGVGEGDGKDEGEVPHLIYFAEAIVTSLGLFLSYYIILQNSIM